MINIQGLPSSTKTPKVYIQLSFGGIAGNTGLSPTKCLMIGNMIASDITGASPSFTCTAGLRQASGVANETPIQVFSSEDSASYFGRGSELHLGAIKFFRVHPTGQLWQCPVSEGVSAVKASTTLTFASGPANASGTIEITVKGESFEVGFSSADTVTTVATAVAKAINARAGLPVTAQNTAGVITITAKQGGTRGNNIRVRAAWINGNLKIPVGTSATAGYGMTAALGAVKLASGSVADNVANALAACTGIQFDRIIGAHDDTTNINKVKDDLVARASVTSMLWGCGVFATVKSPSAAGTDGDTINSEYIQLVASENNEMCTVEIAAQVCGSRLNGDGLAGGTTLGEETFPATNLNGTELRDITVQFDSADIPTPNEIEAMLNSGCSPLAPSDARPGYMMLVASYTTKHLGQNPGSYDYSVAETKVVVVGEYLAKKFRGILSGVYKGKNLVKDAPAGKQQKLPPQAVPPTSVKDFVEVLLRQEETDGIITDVTGTLSELQAEISKTNNQMLLLNVPFIPTPNLSITGLRLGQRA